MGRPPPAPQARRARVPRLLRWVLAAAGLAFAAHLITPQLGQLPSGIAALTGARPAWLAVAALTAATAYAASALALQGAVPVPLPFGRTVQVQVATSFAAIVAPAGVAGMALNVRYLERSGVDRGQALTAVALGRLAAFVVHVVTLAALAPFLLGSLEGAAIPSGRTLLAVTVVVALVVAVAVACAAAHRPSWARVVRAVTITAGRLTSVLGDGRRLTALLGGSFLTTAARAVTLAAALRALGVPAPMLAVVGLHLAAEAIGALGSTPGGLGLLDGALLTGLAALGIPAASAIAAVLIFRLLTFWIPVAPGAVNLRLLRRAGAL